MTSVTKHRGKNNFGNFMVAITLRVMNRKKSRKVIFPAILTSAGDTV
jgi:hypothetical protein